MTLGPPVTTQALNSEVHNNYWTKFKTVETWEEFADNVESNKASWGVGEESYEGLNKCVNRCWKSDWVNDLLDQHSQKLQYFDQ